VLVSWSGIYFHQPKQLIYEFGEAPEVVLRTVVSVTMPHSTRMTSGIELKMIDSLGGLEKNDIETTRICTSHLLRTNKQEKIVFHPMRH
jgi:hypothetical protein